MWILKDNKLVELIEDDFLGAIVCSAKNIKLMTEGREFVLILESQGYTFRDANKIVLTGHHLTKGEAIKTAIEAGFEVYRRINII